MLERIIRINKVLRELNISLEKAVDYLKDNGIEIESNPNTKISELEFNILQSQFAGNKGNIKTSKEVSEEKRKGKEALRVEREKEVEDKRKLEEERLKQKEVIKAKAVLSGPIRVGIIDLNSMKPTPAQEPIIPEKTIAPKDVIPEDNPVHKEEIEALRLERKKEIEDKIKHEKDWRKQLELIKAKATIGTSNHVEETDLAPNSPVEKITDQNPIESVIMTQYQKLSGATLSGQVIDLSQFNKPKKEKEYFKSEANIKSQHHLSIRNKKLGKVKFFDTSKGFGYVHSFDDKKDCFIHISKLISKSIEENDIVVFETVASKKKPGELDATKVSNEIPLFIFNNEFESKSYAYPLMDNHLTMPIALTEKLENGFATITANARLSNWKVTLIPSPIISKKETVLFGKKIIGTFLQNVNMYKSAIEWLSQLLQTELSENELSELYSGVINNFEQKNVLEIKNEINSLKDLSCFHSYFEERKKTLNKISFVLWSQNELDQLPDDNNHSENDFWIKEVFPSLAFDSLQQILIKLLNEKGPTKQVEEFYTKFINDGWKIDFENDQESLISLLESFKSAFPSIKLVENNFTCASNRFYIKLYNRGFLSELSEDRIIQYIEELNSDNEKAEFIEKLPSDKIITYYNSFPNLSKYQDTYIVGLLENEFSKIDFLCFDLESDGKIIDEFAWKTNSVEKSNIDYILKEDGIKDLIALINSEVLIIGQNIKEFDLAILGNHGCSPSNDLIWDTFLIEMLLSPEMKNFALKTKHSATADVKLTLDLFYNQILRILKLPEDELERLFQYISDNFKQKILELKSNTNWNLISLNTINKQKLSFFRPQPVQDKIALKLEPFLKENTSSQNIIIVPDILKKSLYTIENASFFSEEKKKDFGFIDILKVKRLPSNFRWIKICLENIYGYYNNKNLIPYWGNIGATIKIRIEEDLDIFSILSFNEEVSLENRKNLIINSKEFYAVKENFIKNQSIQIYVVNKELVLLENKTCLKTLELTELINSKSRNHFWLKFTGGQSFVEMTKEECLDRGIEILENFDNFWIEKQDFSGFKVWGNYNLEKTLEDNFPHKHYFINADDNSIKQINTFFPKLKIDTNSNEEFISFNPETNYRSRYWLFQKEVLLQIIETNIPTLLVIQNEKEVSALEHYFRRLDFYIPSGEATMARRMELIHQKAASKKMVIISLSCFDKAIENNYLGSLNIIIESLKLFENYFISQNTSLFNNYIEEDFKKNKKSIEEINEDLENEQIPVIEIKKPLFKDLFFHLKLQTPFIHYIQNRVKNNFKENRIWILDPRVSEYNGISEVWNAKSRMILIGKDFNFEKQLKVIESYIDGPKPIKELPFDLEKAKAILSDIFLNGQPWYDEQKPYLDDIIPAKIDRLITLPTGGGKSLLFQGPAILRSAFTNKLTIVVTPLKALMQDQVEALWDKGFYGCVDYLNSDRGTDTRLIYRAIAGGEVSLLFITPERFRSRGFKNALNVRLKTDGGLEYAVFDEAHCVSQWGHEFRPDYFNSAKEINVLKKVANEKFPLLLFSATVSKKIYEDFNTIFS